MHTEIRRRVRRLGLAAAVLAASAIVATACGDGSNEVVLGTDADMGIATPEIGPATDAAAEEPATADGQAPAQDPSAESTERDADATEPPDEPTPEPTVPPVLPVSVPESVSVQLTKMVDVRAPLALVTRTGSPLLYAATKDGLVVAIEIGERSGSMVETVIDVSSQILQGDEQGLLGLAFSPDGSRMYLNYTDLGGDTDVVEYRMNGEIADPSTQRMILEIDQPGIYHNGGHLAFGPDGHLYIGMGDGNSDVAENSQDPTDLLGDVLRIDPLGGDPYAIPPDNPFVERGGAPEIYLTGVRNPWKFSFDRATGDLWIADVGLSTSEEVTVLYASQGRGLGANLGWPLVEGTVPFLGSGPRRTTTSHRSTSTDGTEAARSPVASSTGERRYRNCTGRSSTATSARRRCEGSRVARSRARSARSISASATTTASSRLRRAPMASCTSPASPTRSTASTLPDRRGTPTGEPIQTPPWVACIGLTH
jgi:glucose/arabinose dehydrogenase